MPEWNDRTIVAIDDEYDRRNASNGRSRYEAYLKQNASLFRDSWSDTPGPVRDPNEFAVHAWTVATGPIMAPGFLRVRPDLHGITLHRDDHDLALYANIHVPLHHDQIGGGAGRFPYDWQDWATDRDFGSDYDSLIEPEPSKRPSVLATAVVRVPSHTWPDLPTPTVYEGPQLLDEARAALDLLVACINRDAGPIVAKLRGDA